MEIERGLDFEKNAVDIEPLKKGKRILVFLADFFLVYIITFLLFNVAVAPIGKLITSFDKKDEVYSEAQDELYNHYFQSKVLLKDSSFESYDVTAGLEYTFNCWLSYYVLDAEESINPSFPQYGHKLENENVYHFYNDIRNNNQSYYDLFNNYNKTNSYFSYDEVNKVYLLKDDLKTELYAFFDPKDEMGDQGQKHYDEIQSHLYNPLMAEVMSDIEENDLHYDGEPYSFKECRLRVNKHINYFKNLMVTCTYISHFISWLGYFLIFPLIHRRRRTVAMIMMKVERVNFYTLNHTSRPMYLVYALYSLFSTMILLMFIPSLYVAFNILFSYTLLIFGTIVGIVMSLTGLFFILFNQYNRSLIDFLSNSLYLTENDMDAIYRARGYTI